MYMGISGINVCVCRWVDFFFFFFFEGGGGGGGGGGAAQLFGSDNHLR